MTASALGKRIAKARKMLDLTQQELALRVGISAQSISAFESGRISPSLAYLKKIAQFTHKPLYYFTGEKILEVADRLAKMQTELAELQTLVAQIVECDSD